MIHIYNHHTICILQIISLVLCFFLSFHSHTTLAQVSVNAVDANFTVVDSCANMNGLYEKDFLNPGNFTIAIGTSDGQLSALHCVAKVGGDLKLPPGSQTITVILNAVNEPQAQLFEFTAGTITVSNGAQGSFTLLYQAIQRIEIFFSNVTNVCTDARVFDTLPGVELALHFADLQPTPLSPPTQLLSATAAMPTTTTNCRHQLTMCKLRAAALVSGAVDISVGSHVPRPITPSKRDTASQWSSSPSILNWYQFAYFPLNPLDMPVVQESGDYSGYYPGSGDSYDSSDQFPSWAGPVKPGSSYEQASLYESWGDDIVQNDACYDSAYYSSPSQSSSAYTTPINASSLLPANPTDVLQGTLMVAPSAPIAMNASLINAITSAILSRQWPPLQINFQSLANQLQLAERSRPRVLVASHVETRQGFSAKGATVDALYLNHGDSPALRSVPSNWLCEMASTNYGIPLVPCLGLDINQTAVAQGNVSAAHAIVYADFVDLTLRTRSGNDVFSAVNVTLTPNARISVDLSSGDDSVSISVSNSSLQLYTNEGEDQIYFAADLNAFLTLDLGLNDNYCDRIEVNPGRHYAQRGYWEDDWVVGPVGSTSNAVIFISGSDGCDYLKIDNH